MPDGLANEAKDELWAVYAWWTCVLVLKMNALSWFTGRIRATRQVIHSEEDRMWMSGPDIILCPTGGGHPEVDRIRGAHRHDLETVLPFILTTPMWLTVAPLAIVRMILPCFVMLSVANTLIRMRVVKVKWYCESVVELLEVLVLFYVATSTLLHYAV